MVHLLVILLVHSIVVEIRHHHKEIILLSLWGTLRYQHVRWPTTVAEPELIAVRFIRHCDITERSLVRNGDTGLFRSTHNIILARVNCNFYALVNLSRGV